MRPAIGLIVLASLHCASSAMAQTSLHATGGVSVGYNDNIQGAADEPPEGIPPPVRDFTITVAPGLALLHDQPLWQLRLGYTRAFTFFVRNPEVDTSADQVGATTTIALSPVDQLGLGLNFSRASANLTTLGQPSATQAQAQPTGSFQVFRAGFDERFQHEFTDRLVGIQTAGVTYTASPSAESTEPSRLLSDIGAGPTWEADGHVVASTLSVQHLHGFSRDLANGTRLAPTDQVTPRGQVSWRWTFTQYWSTGLSGGVGLPFNRDGDFVVVPLVGAGLYYEIDLYAASLTYNRNVTTALVTGETFETDGASLDGALPIWAEAGLGIDAALGIARNRVVDSQLASNTLAVNNWVADVGLVWRMPTLPISVGVRYQHVQQFDASENQQRLVNFTRNSGLLTLGYFFPPQNPRQAALPDGELEPDEPQE